MSVVRIVLALIVVLALAAGGYVVSAQRKLIDKIETPPRSAFDPALIEKGARLAAVGDCRICHTAPGTTEADYAGNRAIATPFGTVYSSNITPAPGSGIGHWSEAAFRRAMREGVSRTGRHLYPAFPYDHFTRLDDADIAALYAFVMTRRPVETYQMPNDLIFPLGERWVLAFWNLVFFHPAPFSPDPQHDAEWNRGGYLVTGLGHCGACHTPRNLFGAEEKDRAMAGGEAEGWTAPALDATSPAPLPWDAAHLFQYLRNGWDPQHGAAAGPMQEVTDGMAQADPADVQAIAAYIAAQQGAVSAARRERGDSALASASNRRLQQPAGEEDAAAMFAGACARCHTGPAAAAVPRGIDLALSSVLSEPDPRNAIRIVLDGIRPGEERAGPTMPPFAGTFSDAQMAALLAYLRAHYSTGPGWPDLAAKVRDTRQSGKGS